jgi:hypothetical protein
MASGTGGEFLLWRVNEDESDTGGLFILRSKN